jgi:predicted TIM-barrel fold metal-dependent hydrolase
MAIEAEPKIDCHCHVIDPVHFPYRLDARYRPSGQEIAPVEQLLRVMDRNGVRRALIVGTNSGYGEDLSPVFDALARHPDRFRGMAVVPNDMSARDLAHLKAAGFVGIAFNAAYHGVEYYLGAGDLLNKLADLDLLLQVQAVAEQWTVLAPMLERADVRLVIDHCGRPAPERGLDQPGFRAVLALGRSARAAVKLSGFGQFSKMRHPHEDARPYVEALLAAFTPARTVWGSDFPFLRATERVDYGPLLALAEDLMPDAAVRQTVLWNSPRALFGFPA